MGALDGLPTPSTIVVPVLGKSQQQSSTARIYSSSGNHMSMPAESEDPKIISEESKQSFEKLHELMDELKIVQEHENAVLDKENSK